MSLVQLSAVKAGVQAKDFSDDDELLQRLTDAAEISIAHYLRRDLEVDFPGGIPVNIEQAVIEVVRWLYECEDSDEPSRLPASARCLLAAHRKFT